MVSISSLYYKKNCTSTQKVHIHTLKHAHTYSRSALWQTRARSWWLYGKAMQGNKCQLHTMQIDFHIFFFSGDSKMHPFTTDCSAMSCSFVLAQRHNNSALVKTIEAGGGVQHHASGPEDPLFRETSREGWWNSGTFFSTKNQTLKWTDEGIRRSVCGPLLLAWLGFPGHRYRVTGSEVEVQVIRSQLGFKGQSQGAHWYLESAACGLTKDSSNPTLPPAGCMNSGQLQWLCGCWGVGQYRWPPARKTGRRRHWQCASGW